MSTSDRLDQLEKDVQKLKTSDRLDQLKKDIQELKEGVGKLEAGIAEVKETREPQQCTRKGKRPEPELEIDKYITDEMLDATQRWFEENFPSEGKKGGE